MLAASGITKHLGDRRVLDRVNAAVPQGTFVTILGPSGCGKTTLLRILAGFLNPDAGTIALDGRSLSRPDSVVPPERRDMGMVFQNYAVWPHMTVFGNVAYGLRVRRTPRAKMKSLVAEAIRLVDLAGLEDRFPAQLSGGQQQRVAIARSIVTAPRVLLLDEPLSNLDAKLRKEMLFDLKRIQQRSGITFVYVTHDQAEALSVSDVVIVMNHGRVEQAGPARAIYDDPANLFVASFVGNANIVSGRIDALVDGITTVTWSDRGRLYLPLMHSLPIGTIAEVAIKRHGVTLLPPGAAPNLHGTVKRTYFLGQADEVCVEMDGQELYAFAPPSRFSIGQPVDVRIEPGTFRLFPANATTSHARSP